MSELRDLVSRPSAEFSADFSEWLLPPKRPNLPDSKRYRTGMRNSVAFGVVWIIVFTVANFALTGKFPGLAFSTFILTFALIVGIRTWRNESLLASSEDSLLLETHEERFRAYLQRRQVWSRLRYCSKCGVLFDLLTLQSGTLYELHELANSRYIDGDSEEVAAQSLSSQGTA